MSILPLRDVVVYSHVVIPIFVGRERSVRSLEAAEAAMEQDQLVLLLAQKEASVDDPSVNDLYQIGTIATILQMLKLPDGTVKVMVQGQQRAYLHELVDNGRYFVAKVQPIDSMEPESLEEEIEILQMERWIRSRVKKQMEKSHREYFLNEQIKAINKELGELDEVPDEHETQN